MFHFRSLDLTVKVFLAFVLVSALGCQSLMRKSTDFKPMSYKEETLDNGMRILWIRDGKIPYYGLKLLLPVGGANDPKGQEGLANMVASLLDKGTPDRSALEIASELETLGLSFGSAAGEDSTFIGIEGLSIHSVKATEELFNLLTQSQFSNEELKREAELTQAQLKKMFDNPKSVASVAFEKSLYGSHPYAHLVAGNLKSLGKMKRDDVLQFYKKYYHPKGALLAVFGRFGQKEQDKVRELFSSWKAGKDAVVPTPIPAPVEPKPGLVFVEKSGLKQAEIRMGHLGIRRNNPDYLKLRVANTILGESFIGRLFSEIREKRGLTYSIYSYFDAREEPGPFVISTFTRLDKIPEMITETKKVYADFTAGVSEKDVEDAVSYLKGSFPQVIETGEDLATQLLVLYRYGVDPDYLSDYMTNVSKLDAKDINSVLKAHFHPEDLMVVVYGPPGSEVGLEKFGPIKKLKLDSLY